MDILARMRQEGLIWVKKIELGVSGVLKRGGWESFGLAKEVEERNVKAIFFFLK